MKIKLLIIFFLLNSLVSFSQIDTAAPYWKNKNLPAFVLLNMDSSSYANAALSKDKYTIIMLFNPECEHCQEQFKLLINMPEVSASCQVVLSSTETMDKIKFFYEKFNVAHYPFIHLAKDDQYVFGKFFQPKTIPVLACYDNKQQFIDIKQGQANKEEIRKWLKQ